MKKFGLFCFVALGVSGATTSHAVLFSWTGISNDTGSTLSSSADFTSVGNVLTIVLTNTSAGPSASPADTLGTLLWDFSGSVVTTSSTNNVSLGSSVVNQNNAPYGGGYDLNKEYMYNDGITLSGFNFEHGVSAVGIGQFSTNNDTFYERLRGQGNAGSTPGDAFSISSASGTTGAANNVPVVNNSLTFTLMFDRAVDVNQIRNVAWSFGSGAQTTSVPEPATMAVLGLGAFGLLRRRARSK